MSSRAVAGVAARAAVLAWLVLVWVALWGEPSLGNLLGGLVAGVALLTLFPLELAPASGRVRPLAAARLLVVLAAELVKSSVSVAWASLRPGGRYHQGIVAVPVIGASDALITFVSNALTLTPGSVALEVRRGDPTMILFHVFDLRDPEDVRRGVQRIEALAIRAFGSQQALEALEALERPAPVPAAAKEAGRWPP